MICTTHTAGLGEHRVRELNDEINKLNKVKSYWDTRVIELGGGDQTKGRKFYDVEGDATILIPLAFICLFFYLYCILFYIHTKYY